MPVARAQEKVSGDGLGFFMITCPLAVLTANLGQWSQMTNARTCSHAAVRLKRKKAEQTLCLPAGPFMSHGRSSPAVSLIIESINPVFTEKPPSPPGNNPPISRPDVVNLI